MVDRMDCSAALLVVVVGRLLPGQAVAGRLLLGQAVAGRLLLGQAVAQISFVEAEQQMGHSKKQPTNGSF